LSAKSAQRISAVSVKKAKEFQHVEEKRRISFFFLAEHAERRGKRAGGAEQL